MPNTAFANLPYTCLTDVVQRQDIEDLAEATETAMFRVSEDLRRVSSQPRARIRRASGTQNLPSGTPTVATATLVEFDKFIGSQAANAAAGTITPYDPGYYYVSYELEIQAQVDLADAVKVEIQYGGQTRVARKWSSQGMASFSLPAIPYRLSGLVLCNQYDQALRGQVTLFSNGGSRTYLIYSTTFTAQKLARCAVPLNSNPYFSTATSPWTATNTTLTLSSTSYLYGPFSLRSTPTGTLPAILSEFVPVTAGSVYRGHAYVSSDLTRTYHTELRWFDGVGTPVGSAAVGAGVSMDNTTYRIAHVSGTAPVGATQAKLVIVADGAGTPSPAYIDNTWLTLSC